MFNVWYITYSKKMNWLAHLFLSQPTGEHRLGNLMGDLVKGKERVKLDSCFAEGLNCHLSIDRFTDTHAIVRQSKRRISSEFRRYSGVLVDVFYDYFLAKNLQLYCDTDLATFTQDVYISILEPLAIAPPRIRLIVQLMIEQDWLGSYAYRSGIETTLTRIKAKLSNKHHQYFRVQDLMAELDTNYDDLEQDFLLFFPKLTSHISSVESQKQIT